MNSGFIEVARTAGNLIEVCSRGTLSLPDLSDFRGKACAACRGIVGRILVVGDVRETRVAGDEISPIVFDIMKEASDAVERVGLLVDSPPRQPVHAASYVTHRSSEQAFHRAADLFSFFGGTATPEEWNRLVKFINERATPDAEIGAYPTEFRPRRGEDGAEANMTGSILLVEDNPDDVALTLGAFRKGKLVNEIVVASDGVEALDWLFATGFRAGHPPLMPQLVLLDLQLPRVDGLEVLRRIRSHDRTRLQPVVILTSSADQRDFIEGYRLGINSYIRKPVEFAEFSEAVGQLNLYWQLTSLPASPYGGPGGGKAPKLDMLSAA
jgi:two-component system response regulator